MERNHGPLSLEEIADRMLPEDANDEFRAKLTDLLRNMEDGAVVVGMGTRHFPNVERPQRVGEVVVAAQLNFVAMGRGDQKPRFVLPCYEFGVRRTTKPARRFELILIDHVSKSPDHNYVLDAGKNYSRLVSGIHNFLLSFMKMQGREYGNLSSATTFKDDQSLFQQHFGNPFGGTPSAGGKLDA